MMSSESKTRKNKSKNITGKATNSLLETAMCHIQPSRELLDFYRRKVIELTSDHEMMSRRLEQLNESCQMQHKFNAEIHEREEEISDLQKALSDMQVYLFKEREQVLRLFSENDRLKIRELEDRRKIAHLLQLSGLTQSEVTYFIKDPPTKAVVEPTDTVKMVTSDGFYTSVTNARRANNTKKNANNSAVKGDNVSNLEHESVKRELESCKVQIQALQSQLEEQTRLYKEQTEALMEDRRIRQEETQAQRTRDTEKIQDLSDKLKRTQELLYENTKDFLSQRSQYREKEKQLISDKDNMYRKLQLKESSLHNLSKENKIPPHMQSLQMKAWDEYTSTSLTVQKMTEREERYKSELNDLDYQLSEQQKLGDVYREQVVELETELGRLREEEGATRDEYQSKAVKLNERLQLMNRRYKELERRRLLEQQGFQADIANLRKKLRTLEKQLYSATLNLGEKLTYGGVSTDSGLGGNVPDNLDLAVLQEVKQTAKRSHYLSGQLKDLKAMMYGLEKQLRQL